MKALKGKKNPRHLAILVWLYAIVVSIPYVVNMKGIPINKIPETQGMDCKSCADKKICDIPQNAMGQVSTTVYFVLAFLVPLVVIFVLYTKIAIFLHQRSNNGMMHKVATRSKSKAVRMLTVAVLAVHIIFRPVDSLRHVEILRISQQHFIWRHIRCHLGDRIWDTNKFPWKSHNLCVL